VRAIAFAILALLYGLGILSQRHRRMEPSPNTFIAYLGFLAATLICIIGGW
jgi:hypothetical protein